MPRYAVDRCWKTAWRQWASLVDSAAGLDVCVRSVIVHAVSSGARVPSGEVRGQVGIVLFEAAMQMDMERLDTF